MITRERTLGLLVSLAQRSIEAPEAAIAPVAMAGRALVRVMARR